MHRIYRFALAAALLAAPTAVEAAAMDLTTAAAVRAGKASCPAKYPGSRQQVAAILFPGCWSCPAATPNRTLHPSPRDRLACERPRRKTEVGFAIQRRPRIGLKPCPKGTKLSINGCVSCPGGTRMETTVLSGRKLARVRCVRITPAAHNPANYRGKPGCPKGAFRNGLTGDCFRCPAGMVRSPTISKNLDKDPRACFGVKLNIPAPQIKPPKWLTATAKDLQRGLDEILARREMVEAMVAAGNRLKRHLAKGGSLGGYSDPEMVREIILAANRPVRRRKAKSVCDRPENRFFQPMKSVAWGVVGDGAIPTPLVVTGGANLTHEYVFDFGAPIADVGRLISLGGNIGLPSLTGAAAIGSQVTVYAEPFDGLDGWALGVEGGYTFGVKAIPLPFPQGYDLTFSLNLKSVGSVHCPYLLGVTLGANWTAASEPSAEFDVGPVYSWKLPR